MWSMFGQYSRDVWTAVGPYSYIQMHGCVNPIPVIVSRDPHGEYLGWLKTGESEPTMILKSNIFEIQFPYGSRAEVERGRGAVLSLDVRIDLAVLTLPSVRAFQEWGSTNSARWFILPDGRVFHSRDAGHLIPSQHGQSYISASLEEITGV